MDVYHVSRIKVLWDRFRNFRKWLFCPLARKLNWRWLYSRAKCERYEDKWRWVWICPTCRNIVPEGTPNAIYQKFLKDNLPDVGCVCPPPTPEKVKRTVCIRSGKLPGQFCIHRKQMEFEKGKEPTTKCHLHKYKKSGRREEMCSGSLGMFLSFLREGWKKENQIKAEDDIMEVLAEMAKRDIKYNDFFLWLCDNKFEHKPLNDKTPYKQWMEGTVKKIRMFDLSVRDERFWELFDRFVYMHSLFGIIPLPQFFMDRYCDYAFKNNVNGVSGKVLSPESLLFCYNVIDWAVPILKKYFKATPVKFINEPRHGNDSMFHTIAVWHRKMYEHFKKYFSTKEEALRNVITDNSGSEAGQMLLVWHAEKENMKCPKCGKLISKLFPNLLTYSWMDRLRIGEQHSVTLWADFEKGYNSLKKFFRSANRKCRWHEDGASNEDANGHVFGPFQFADAEQYGETCDFVWSQQVANGKKKTNYMCIFACETLLYVGGIYYETWRKDTVNWKRYDKMYESHVKHFG